ncbi:MAG TPA: hypothetical protein VEC39_05675 [Vicinamibacterales bacterium]|nr:hypothetical protein [Vicinamibacterales bacterium]
MVAVKRAAWVLVGVFAAAVSLEVALKARAAWLQSDARQQSPLARRMREYAPFAVQHLHPHYLFFFPLDPADRLRLANAACSLDANGYREPGPAHAGGRLLAVLLGGSAAFGYYASSNDATITSRLNALQDRYFFINAAVPSWNSTQELQRLTLEITALRPALIVAFDGVNDAVLAGQIRPGREVPYAAGTPEHFADLELIVARDDEGFTWQVPSLFPEIRQRVERWSGRSSGEPDTADPATINAAAYRYRENHRTMSVLARGLGARFVSVFQPVANLHRHAIATRSRPLIAAFHHRLRGHADYESADFSAIFDRDFTHVAIAGTDLSADAIFVDDVHLTDRGNDLVARYLAQRLGLGTHP